MERSEATSSIDSYVENSLRYLHAAFEEARNRQNAAAEDMRRRADQARRENHYEPGEKVWVSDPTASAGGKRKLGLAYKGPGTVVRSLGDVQQNNIYKIEMPDGKVNVLHHDRLKPFIEYRSVENSRAEQKHHEATLVSPRTLGDMTITWGDLPTKSGDPPGEAVTNLT